MTPREPIPIKEFGDATVLVNRFEPASATVTFDHQFTDHEVSIIFTLDEWDRVDTEVRRVIRESNGVCHACTGTGFETTDPEDASRCLRCNGTGREPKAAGR